ncbi:MAG: hypothetical protein IJO33_01585 [Bacilli bacterium]|nr:hypothetical protein [Bacilli bacterium]
MNKIDKMIVNTILQTIFVILICIFSFIMFDNLKLEDVQEELAYTNMEISKNEDAYIAIDEFSNEEQITITIINESNSYENYNVLLTSEINLEQMDEHIYIKIDEASYTLEQLLLKDNYYQIMSGKLKASNKQVKIYLAIDNEYIDLFNDNVSFSFVNENIVI